MKRFARALAVLFGLVILGSIISLVPQKGATAANGAPVNITGPLPLPVTGAVNATVTGSVNVANTAANPVPVSGAVAVGNERTLVDGGFVPVPLEVSVTNSTLPVTGSVGISGTPTVQLSGPVSVANTPANPVPVSIQQSAKFTTLFSAAGGGYSQVLPDGNFSTFTIQPGEQFVVTDVNWLVQCIAPFCTLSAGDAVVVQFGTFYSSEGTYSNRGGNLFAGRSDHLTSGIVLTQLPLPTILGVPSPTESPLFFVVHGYLTGIEIIVP